MPLKVGVYALLIGFGTLLGVYSPTLYAQSKGVIARFTASGDKNFDPDILEHPERELDFIQSVNKGVQPRLKRVQILIRKQVAEIEYMKEKCRFLERHVPLAQGESRSAEQVLSECAAQGQDGNISAVSAEQRKLFESAQAWVSWRERIQISERSLKELCGLDARVNFLQGKLEERRLATLRYVPASNEDRIQSPGVREVLIPEIEEAKGLLEDIHETLFKTVYALDPILLKENDALVRVSSLTQ